MIKVRVLNAHAPCLTVSCTRTRSSKPSVGIVFTGDKDLSIQRAHARNFCLFATFVFGTVYVDDKDSSTQRIYFRTRSIGVALTFFRALKTFRLTFLRMRNKFKSLMSSKKTKHFRYKCHELFVNCDHYCEEFLKMSFNAIKYYVFCQSLSPIMAHYCHVIYACYQNIPQNLFASC